MDGLMNIHSNLAVSGTRKDASSCVNLVIGMQTFIIRGKKETSLTSALQAM